MKGWHIVLIVVGAAVALLVVVIAASIGLMLYFGNQVRSEFGAGTKKMVREPVIVDTYADKADQAEEVKDLGEAFRNP